MIARDKRGSVVLAEPNNSPMVGYPEVNLEATVQKTGFEEIIGNVLEPYF